MEDSIATLLDNLEFAREKSKKDVKTDKPISMEELERLKIIKLKK